MFAKEVWDSSSKLAIVNQTDICLIPKKHHPQNVNHFRPISLCNVIYKTVSKVLVERLKASIQNLVSPFQSGFALGRNIHENVIVAQEIIHSMRNMKGKKGFFAIKVDLSKAYNKLSCDFIWRFLEEIKLPQQMLNIILHGVMSVETNINWNDNPSNYSRSERGISQGVQYIHTFLFFVLISFRI